MKRLIFICFIISFVCCKKEEVHPDTYVPPTPPPTPNYGYGEIYEYFPVYPKSIWYYKDINGQEVIHKTDSTYQLCISLVDNFAAYLPKYDGRFVNGYAFNVAGVYPWSSILPKSLSIGPFITSRSKYGPEGKGTVDAIVDSVTVNGVAYQSVVIATYYLVTGPGPDYSPCSRTYYARNVGIIKRSSIDYKNNNAETEQETLVSYKIGKK